MKKLIISAFCMYLCILGCFTGCDSGLASPQEITSLEINGWTLSSAEGEEAVMSRSASNVTAVKNIEYDGKMYICRVTGNADSVIDRVSDPLFGSVSVNYSDEAIQKYLKSFNTKSILDVAKKQIRIALTPATGESSEYSDSFPVYSEMPPFNLGIGCSQVFCQVNPVLQNMQFTAYFMSQNTNSTDRWIPVGGSDQIFSYMGSTSFKSTWHFGWQQWQLNFSVYSGGKADISFEWYGAALK